RGTPAPSFRSQTMRPPPPARTALAKKTAAVAVRAMEGDMKVLTESELLRLNRLELLALLRQTANELAAAPERLPDRKNALITLRRINGVLARNSAPPYTSI